MTPKFIKLSNGVIVRLEDLQCISRQGLNDYHLVLRDCPIVAKADGPEVKRIEDLLGKDLLIFDDGEEDVKPTVLAI